MPSTTFCHVRAIASTGFGGALAVLALRIAYLTLRALFGPAMPASP